MKKQRSSEKCLLVSQTDIVSLKAVGRLVIEHNQNSPRQSNSNLAAWHAILNLEWNKVVCLICKDYSDRNKTGYCVSDILWFLSLLASCYLRHYQEGDLVSIFRWDPDVMRTLIVTLIVVYDVVMSSRGRKQATHQPRPRRDNIRTCSFIILGSDRR